MGVFCACSLELQQRVVDEKENDKLLEDAYTLTCFFITIAFTRENYVRVWMTHG